MNDMDVLHLGLDAFSGLLGEFREGNIANGSTERQALEGYLKRLSERWNCRFPGFPNRRYTHASLMGVLRRGVRDRYLKRIIVQVLGDEGRDFADRTIVNLACVISRHARDLASRLPSFKVIATDIDPWPSRLYRCVPWTIRPRNYEFKKDNIFEPKVHITPAAVVFFGACGSVSDGAIDFAINSNARYLICRTCCHDNIAGNTEIKKRFSNLNRAFRIKNFFYSIAREKLHGYYFSQKYSKAQYPRSEAAKGLSNSDEFLEISQNSVDSDICRTIIDLDRYLLLVENGYDVWYRGELFVAEKVAKAV